MEELEYHVFLSYRRSDGVHFARSVKADLEKLGEKVFLDMDNIGNGPFDVKLTNSIRDCLVVVPIWQRSYFEKCSTEDDWVRKELELAIANKKIIIPLQDRDYVPPQADSVPESIRPVLLYNAVQYFAATHEACILKLQQQIKSCRLDLYKERVVGAYVDGHLEGNDELILNGLQAELNLTDAEADSIKSFVYSGIVNRKKFDDALISAANDGRVTPNERIDLITKGRKFGYNEGDVQRLIDETLTKRVASVCGAHQEPSVPMDTHTMSPPVPSATTATTELPLQVTNQSNEQDMPVAFHPGESPASELHHQVELQQESPTADQFVAQWFTSIRDAIFT